MNRTWILVATFIIVVAVAGGVFIYFSKDATIRDESNGKLVEAREMLESVRATGDFAKGRNILVTAKSLASEAGNLHPSGLGEALAIEGECLLYLTKYREASTVLERALELDAGNTRLAGLAARASHEAYKTGRKDSDYGRAVQLYDQAIALGGDAEILLYAGMLQEDAQHPDLADGYFDKLEARHPDSPEANTARGVRSKRQEAGR